MASFNIESTRYVNYKRGVEVVLPIEFYKENIKGKIENAKFPRKTD